MKLSKRTIQFFTLFLFFISVSAHQFQTGFDEYFRLISFALLIIVNLIIEKKIKLTNVLKWGLLFWAYYFLSTIWAKNTNDTMIYFAAAVQILGLFVILSTIIHEKNDINKILKILLLSLGYTTILLIVRTPFSYWGTERVGGVIGANANGLGMQMAIGVLISFYMISHNKKINEKKSNVFYILCIILFSIITLLSGSRKALIILIIGVIAYELLSSKGIASLLKLAGFGVVVFLLMFMIFNNKALYNIIGIRLEQLVLTATGNESESTKDTSLIEREFYIEEAVKLFKSHPIIGYGGNNFKTRMREIKYWHIAYSHNNFTELLCTLGIIGFILYYYYWVYLIVSLFKKFKNDKVKDNLNILLLVILIILVALDYFNVSYVNIFNFIIVTLANIYIQISNTEKEIIKERK